MPELPDILLYLHALAPRVVGKRVEGVRLAAPFLLRSVAPPLSAVDGKMITALHRLGKRIVFELEGLSCGYDIGSPVIAGRYQSPFAFTGTLHSVTIDVSGTVIEDEEATLRMVMARQ